MIFSSGIEKDLDSWICEMIKVVLHEDDFYAGILISELKNELLIQSSGNRIYIQCDSIVSLEEI
jgi:hypothetical protein